jgi:hypothetical protein
MQVTAVGTYDALGQPVGSSVGNLNVNQWVWQPSTLSYIQVSADASGNINVTGGGSGGGGTQYVDGVTVATPTGTVSIGRNPSNVLHALSLDASGNLNVNLAAGTISGGNAAAGLTGAAVPADAGYTGWNSAGNLVGVSLTNALPVQPGTGVTFSITAAALPLPTGAATQTTLAALLAALGTPAQAGGAVSVSNFPATQPISAASLPLPTGAATQTTLASVLTALGAPLQETGGSVSVSNFPATQAISGTVTVVDSVPLSVTVSNFPGTQSVSGTVAATQGTTPWVENLTQFGGNPVVTGTGISGAGIPRVTTSSDSSLNVGNFPGTQIVAATSLPLPTNAAQESGGNLALLTGLLSVQAQILAELRALRLQNGAAYGVIVDPLSETLTDTLVN